MRRRDARISVAWSGDGFEAVCELGGEANVAHDETGLRREVVEEPQVGRRERAPGKWRNGDRADELAAVAHRELVLRAGKRWQHVPVQRHGRERRTDGSSGQVAAGTSSSPTRNHTHAVAAPLPSTRICAMCDSTSVDGYELAMRSDSSVSTSYGVEREPYTRRCAVRSAPVRTRSKANATTAVAATDSAVFGPEPSRLPSPTGKHEIDEPDERRQHAVHEDAGQHHRCRQHRGRPRRGLRGMHRKSMDRRPGS